MTKTLNGELANSTGWLINPCKKLVLFFIQDPKQEPHEVKVITQLWHATAEGIPIKIKNTRTMKLKDALETWEELLGNGWELVEHQINKDAA